MDEFLTRVSTTGREILTTVVGVGMTRSVGVVASHASGVAHSIKVVFWLSVYTSASVASPTGPTVGCVNKLCGVFFSAVTAAAANAPVYSKYDIPIRILVRGIFSLMNIS